MVPSLSFKGAAMIDMTGQRFGRWVVVRLAHAGYTDALGKACPAKWTCLCDCGSTRDIPRNNLTTGASSSCGCLKREMQTTHGMTKDPMYKTWVSIRLRIQDPTNADYPTYGGRGLTMEPEWARDFSTFRAWVVENIGPKPSPDRTIDRKNNDLGYLKGNLRWATVLQQQNNRRNNRMLTYEGETMNMKQWCTKLDLNYGAVKMRLGKMGWTVEQALGTPTDGDYSRKVFLKAA